MAPRMTSELLPIRGLSPSKAQGPAPFPPGWQRFSLLPPPERKEKGGRGLLSLSEA